MTAYSKTDLYNKYVQEQASEAFFHKCIDEDAYRRILETYKHSLYTPNYFIRIGLAVLSFVAILLSLLLVALITGTSSDSGIIFLCILFAIVCYIMLEAFIKLKKYYNAGIDNTLMVSIVIFIITAFAISEYEALEETASCAALLVCVWLAVRFADAFMAMAAYLAAVSFLFFTYIHLGVFGRLSIPFALMLFSALIFFILQKMLLKDNTAIYHKCLQCMLLLTLLTFYGAGNYFVVNELGIEMFNTSIALGWLFWIFTLGIPVAYIIYGLKKKARMFYTTGFVLLTLAVLTVRYYHTVMPAEIAMIVFGSIIIIITYALIKYLSTPKHGFTFEDTGHKSKSLINAEALIIAEVFGKKMPVQTGGVQFGGGSAGGGGASGRF